MEVATGLWMLILQGSLGAPGNVSPPVILTVYASEANCRVASALIETHFYTKPMCLQKTK